MSDMPNEVWLSLSDNGTYLEDWSSKPFVADDDTQVTVAKYVRADLDSERRKALGNRLQEVIDDPAQGIGVYARNVLVEVETYLRGLPE